MEQDYAVPPAVANSIGEIPQDPQSDGSLAALQAELSAIYDHSQTVLLIFDSALRVARANPAASAFSGRQPDRIVGRSIGDALACSNASLDPRGCGHARPCGLCGLRRILRDTLETRHSYDRAELALSLAGDPALRSAQVCASPLPGSRVLLSLLDTTGLRSAGSRSLQTEQQLQQSYRLQNMGRIAGGIAHDFNNLLTVINGYSRLVLRDLDPSHPIHTRIGAIVQAGERAAALARQLLDFGRPPADAPARSSRLDLDAVLREMSPLLARVVGEDVEVSLSLDSSGASVGGDAPQWERVILNLAANARDAMPQGGRLCIRTALAPAGPGSPAELLLTVSDTGIGMTRDVSRRIFDPLFTTKGPSQGTGLGLSVVRDVVAHSGGRIEVDTAPGQGAAFRIFLPVARPAPAPTVELPAVPAPAEAPAPLGQRVLDALARVKPFGIGRESRHGSCRPTLQRVAGDRRDRSAAL